MKNLSGVPLLHLLPTSHRPASKLPLTTPAERAGGAAGEATARSLARRLVLVLRHLGLDGVVPGGWITVDGAVIRFAELDVPTADHLVCHLEDIASDVAGPTAVTAAGRRRAGAGQAALFGRGEQ